MEPQFHFFFFTLSFRLWKICPLPFSNFTPCCLTASCVKTSSSVLTASTLPAAVFLLRYFACETWDNFMFQCTHKHQIQVRFSYRNLSRRKFRHFFPFPTFCKLSLSCVLELKEFPATTILDISEQRLCSGLLPSIPVTMSTKSCRVKICSSLLPISSPDIRIKYLTEKKHQTH